MLHKIEPTIRRMEYRIAYAPTPLPVLSKMNLSATEDLPAEVADTESHDEFLLWTERLREHERQSTERESALMQQLEAVKAEAYERGRREEESSHKAAIERIQVSATAEATPGNWASRRHPTFEQFSLANMLHSH